MATNTRRWDVSPDFWIDAEHQAEQERTARAIRLYHRDMQRKVLAQPPGLLTYAITGALMAAAMAFVSLSFGG